MAALAFVCAMPMELRPLVKQPRPRADDRWARPVRAGTLDGREVVAIVTGMGTALATDGDRRAARRGPDVERVVVVRHHRRGRRRHRRSARSSSPSVVVEQRDRRRAPPRPLGGRGRPTARCGRPTCITPPDELPALRAQGVVSPRHGDRGDRRASASSAASRGRCSAPSATAPPTAASTTRCSTSATRTARRTPPAIARYVLRHPGPIPGMARMAKGAKLATERAADAVIAAARTLP